jgi:hypothetical protein
VPLPLLGTLLARSSVRSERPATPVDPSSERWSDVDVVETGAALTCQRTGVTHDPDHVARLIAELGRRAIYDPRLGPAPFEVPTGAKLVSISTDPDIGPCSEEERDGTLTRRREDEGLEEFAARV